MDEQNGRLWINRVWKPYAKLSNNSFLLLDTFQCQMQKYFVDKLHDIGTEVEFISGGCTSVLQPCDVGINKPFKHRLRERYMAWCVSKYQDLSPTQKLPVPYRQEIALWVSEVWESLEVGIVKNAWKCCGLQCPT